MSAILTRDNKQRLKARGELATHTLSCRLLTVSVSKILYNSDAMLFTFYIYIYL